MVEEVEDTCGKNTANWHLPIRQREDGNLAWEEQVNQLQEQDSNLVVKMQRVYILNNM